MYWLKTGSRSHSKRLAPVDAPILKAPSLRRFPVISQQRGLSSDADDDDAGENDQVRLEWSAAFDKKLHEVISRCVSKTYAMYLNCHRIIIELFLQV
jgi:hypothetical protein